MRCGLNVKLYGIMIANAVLCACFADVEAEKQAKWTELENYGVARFKVRFEPWKTATNDMPLAIGEYDDETDRKWFCEMVSFSMPTNDVDAYSRWMDHKTQLILSSISSQNTVGSWRKLAAFLADMKAKRGLGDSAQFIQAHREEWKKSHRLSTMEEWNEWRRAYQRAKRYRTIFGRAVWDTERAFGNLAESLQPEWKKALGEIILEYTGTKPDWYLDEKKKDAK